MVRFQGPVCLLSVHVHTRTSSKLNLHCSNTQRTRLRKENKELEKENKELEDTSHALQNELDKRDKLITEQSKALERCGQPGLVRGACVHITSPPHADAPF
jgi:cell division protein FtsB